MDAPRWRARLVFVAIGFLAVVGAAWRYVPELSDAVKVVWGDAKGEVRQRL